MADPDPKTDPKKDPEPEPKNDPTKNDPEQDPDWKSHARTWEDRAKADKKRADDLQAELDKVKEKTQSEQEKAIDAAKAEGRTEALTVANKRVVKAAVKVAAAGKLADPSDAASLLDLEQFEVNADGDVDQKKVDAAIDRLLEEKPHLAAKGARPSGDGGGGPRGDPAGGKESMNDLIRRKAGRT